MKRPSKELPDWECRTPAQRRRLEEWTLEQLRLSYEPHPDDIRREALMMEDESYIASAGLRLARGRIVEAVEKKDVATLVLLTKDPALRRFAFQQVFRRPKAGRKKGVRRKSDAFYHLPTSQAELMKARLEDAAEDVARIRYIWKVHHDKQNRSDKNPPMAEDIAAKYNKIKKEDLIAYRKRRGR